MPLIASRLENCHFASRAAARQSNHIGVVAMPPTMNQRGLIPAKAIIVSAADELYFSLLRDLVASIRHAQFDVAFELGVIDIGLSEESLGWLRQQGVRVEKARSDIAFPGRASWEEKKPGSRTLTARLFMRDYFPDFDVYMWMDSDVWVQTPEAINTMIAAAADNQAMHIVCEMDRCYSLFFDSVVIWHIFKDWYTANYGEQVAAAMALKPMLNAGVWTMRKDSPVWQEWIRVYTDALQRLQDLTDKSFMADQLGLNILLYIDKLPHVRMPAYYNWMTFYALPMFDRQAGLYVEPVPPYRPISHLHLTRPVKAQTEELQCVGGGTVSRPLTFGGWKD